MLGGKSGSQIHSISGSGSELEEVKSFDPSWPDPRYMDKSVDCNSSYATRPTIAREYACVTDALHIMMMLMWWWWWWWWWWWCWWWWWWQHEKQYIKQTI